MYIAPSQHHYEEEEHCNKPSLRDEFAQEPVSNDYRQCRHNRRNEQIIRIQQRQPRYIRDHRSERLIRRNIAEAACVKSRIARQLTNWLVSIGQERKCLAQILFV